MNPIALATHSIEHFSIDEEDYSTYNGDGAITVSNQGSGNAIFTKGELCPDRFHINYNHHNNCKIFIGNNLRGDISVNFNGDNAVLYLGDNCDLKQLQIRSRQADDFIAIGEEVSVAGNNVWVSGNGAGNCTPAIIIGDDCMFSFDVLIRNSDAHPIFSGESHQQINEPTGAVHIEPHVWVGERVSILKDTTIGACSIIALGSTVTKDISRFSNARGVPAVATAQDGSYWSRDHSQFAIKQAKYYTDKFSHSH